MNISLVRMGIFLVMVAFVIIGVFTYEIESIGNPFYMPSVAAAPVAPPEVFACAPINTAGLIVVYRCSPEQGAPYLINSLGFMKDEE